MRLPQLENSSVTLQAQPLVPLVAYYPFPCFPFRTSNPLVEGRTLLSPSQPQNSALELISGSLSFLFEGLVEKAQRFSPGKVSLVRADRSGISSSEEVEVR